MSHAWRIGSGGSTQSAGGLSDDLLELGMLNCWECLGLVGNSGKKIETGFVGSDDEDDD